MQHTLPEVHGLLAPITPTCPAGSDLHTNDLFLRTRDIRTAARDSERQRAQGNVCDNLRLRQQWLQIATLCCDILTSHSKDLDVCAWLIEAWSRLRGLRGIADGFTLYRELLMRYWDCLYPSADASDVAARVSALNALNGGNRTGTLVEAVHYFFVTGPVDADRGVFDSVSDDDGAHFTLWQYHAAIDAQRLADDDKRQQRIALLGFSPQHIQHTADNTATASYQAQLADCDAAQHALRQLDDELARIIDTDCPSTALIHTALDNMRDALMHLAGKRIVADIGSVSRDQVFPNHESAIPINADVTNANVTNTNLTLNAAPALQQMTSQPRARQRHEAIAQLSEVARYFRTMEPHSPLAGAIDRLVRWANLPCDELMRELIPDRNARDALWLMTGIAPDSPSPAGS
jgi:type VI secretion system protein ImpA